jgi:hypothetical protein
MCGNAAECYPLAGLASSADFSAVAAAAAVQELVAEVERRQSGILQPQSPKDAARTPLARQKRLRVARTVLSARMQQQRAAGLAAAAAAAAGAAAEHGSGNYGGGGFVPQGEHGSSGWQAGMHDGWGDFKRQRL